MQGQIRHYINYRDVNTTINICYVRFDLGLQGV